MLGFDQQKIRWHRREVPLGELARLWKSYLAKDAYESPSQQSGMGHPSLPPLRP